MDDQPKPVGSTMFVDLLADMERLHVQKARGYSPGADPWENFRTSERIGIPAWKGALVRLFDKVNRVISLTSQDLDSSGDESLEDTLFDLSAYSLIVLCLRRGDGLTQQVRWPATDISNATHVALYDEASVDPDTGEAELVVISPANEDSGGALAALERNEHWAQLQKMRANGLVCDYYSRSAFGISRCVLSKGHIENSGSLHQLEPDPA